MLGLAPFTAPAPARTLAALLAASRVVPSHLLARPEAGQGQESRTMTRSPAVHQDLLLARVRGDGGGPRRLQGRGQSGASESGLSRDF